MTHILHPNHRTITVRKMLLNFPIFRKESVVLTFNFVLDPEIDDQIELCQFKWSRVNIVGRHDGEIDYFVQKLSEMAYYIVDKISYSSYPETICVSEIRGNYMI